MEPLGLTVTKLAKHMQVHRHTVMRVIHNETRLTIDFARRLSVVFGTSIGIWLRLQQARDEWEAEQLPSHDLATLTPIDWQKTPTSFS